MAFRCTAASLARGEPALGSASTVRAFLLVENAGPWGQEALRDARFPDDVRAHLQSAARVGVRVLLVRRHRTAATPGVRVFAAYAHPHAPWLESATLPGVQGLLDLDLVALGRGRSVGLERTESPVFCVCTHGRHDACCAELGRPAAASMSAAHPDLTWEVSHVGGDRFAANVLVLPDGLYYGRVGAGEAAGLGERHLGGHLDLELLRGRSGFGFPVQVAEIAVRRETGETRTRAVRLVSASRSGDDTAVVLAVGDTSYDVVVRCTTGSLPHLLSCRAALESVVPAWSVVSLTSVA